MTDTTLQMILGIVRHVLSGAGAALVADGYLTNSQEADIIGGIIAAVGVAWSMWQKHAAAQKLVAAAATGNPAGKAS